MLEQVMADNGFPVPLVEGGDCRVFQFHSGTGEGIMTQYDLFPGVSLMYNDFHMESYDSAFRTTEDLLCIDYCRQGRMEYPAGPDAYSYVEAGDLKLDRRLEHQGHFTFPLAHYHEITVGFALPQAAQSLKEWIREFPVDLARLQNKFCSSRHPKVLHGAPSIDHIFQELYAVPEQIKIPYFRIKVLELLLLLERIPQESGMDSYYSAEQTLLAHHLRDHLLTNREGYVSLAQLAAEHAISVSHLQKLFKQTYGMPVYHYIKEYRLEQAAVELVRSRKPITEIAQHAGYDNASKFSESFKKRYGKTPSRYRADKTNAVKRSIETKTE